MGHDSFQLAKTIDPLKLVSHAIELPKAVVSECSTMHCTEVMMMDAIYGGERMAGRLG